MVSVSFDEYQSIFEETIRKDQIVTPTCFVETKGESSGIFKKYRLGRGFTNYLLDDNGVIIAMKKASLESKEAKTKEEMDTTKKPLLHLW